MDTTNDEGKLEAATNPQESKEESDIEYESEEERSVGTCIYHNDCAVVLIVVNCRLRSHVGPKVMALTDLEYFKSRYYVWLTSDYTVVVVVVFTLTDRASTIPSNIRGCQSGTWSQRGTKVNRSHHGDNPLLRPTGIQIATKSYATLQAMAPTNSKTVHQTSFTPYREQPRSTRIVVAYPRPAFSATNRTNTFQPVLINNSKFLKATHRTKIRKIEIPRSMVVEALSC